MSRTSTRPYARTIAGWLLVSTLSVIVVVLVWMLFKIWTGDGAGEEPAAAIGVSLFLVPSIVSLAVVAGLVGARLLDVRF